jgi:hypothetical protein
MPKFTLVPLSELNVPAQHILQGHFMYSTIPCPSPAHAAVLNKLSKELELLRYKDDQCRLVNCGVVAHLTPLADDKPGLIVGCGMSFHKFIKFCFINGSGEHKTMDIGYWQIMVSFLIQI